VQLQPEPSLADRAAGRRKLLIIAGLFFVPLALSFAVYYGNLWRPTDTSNNGTLITPARPLESVLLTTAPQPSGVPGVGAVGAPIASSDLFRGKWSLVYIGDGACDLACQEALVFGRQVRLTLNNEMTRVQRVFLTTGACCNMSYLKAEHEGLTTVDASSAEGTRLLAQFPSDARAEMLYVVDPLGNLMMQYDTRESPKGLQSDLKKLLKLSHIG
jgi:hypothetical protein